MIEQRAPWLPDLAREATINRTFDGLLCTAQCCCLVLDKLGIKQDPNSERLQTLRGFCGFNRELQDYLRSALPAEGYAVITLHCDKNENPPY